MKIVKITFANEATFLAHETMLFANFKVHRFVFGNIFEFQMSRQPR